MLPYLELQILYALASLLAVLAFDATLGRARPFRGRPWRRAGVIAACVAIPAGAWFGAVKVLDHSHSTYQFIAIAFGFYAAVLWLPLVTLFHCLRARGAGSGTRALALASVAAIAVGQYALWIEPNRLVTRTHELAFDAWPADAPPLRVVHVSDLQTVGACARERRAAEIVNALRPDLIVFTGDYVAGPFSDPEPAIAAARAFLGALERPRLGIVCVAGHSESESIRKRVFAGLDVHYLCNDELEIALDGARRLRIFGARALGADFSRLVARREPELVTFALTHEPDVSAALEGKGVDLHFAGHTHGGQVALPWFGPPMTLSTLPARFARGLHRFGDHWIHVNPGLGMEGNHAPRIRFLCPPEIDLLLVGGSGARQAVPAGGAGEPAELADR